MSDYIDRQAAIDAIAEYLSKTTYTSAISHLNTGALILARVPSAEPKKGKWLKAYGDHEAFGVRPFYRYCSECNESTVWAYNFCPNCGARMEE